MPEVEVAVNETTRDLEALLRCGLAFSFSSGEVVERDDADCGLADGGLADAGVARYAGFERSAHLFSELRVFIVQRLAGCAVEVDCAVHPVAIALKSYLRRGFVQADPARKPSSRTDCVPSRSFTYCSTPGTNRSLYCVRNITHACIHVLASIHICVPHVYIYVVGAPTMCHSRTCKSVNANRAVVGLFCGRFCPRCRWLCVAK